MTRTSTLKGIAWMALTGLLFVAVTGIVRHLGTDMSPVQAAFIRYAMGVVIMAPIILRVRWTRIASGRVGMFLTRGLVHGAGVMLWFYAMAHIPIAEVTALGFTAPIFTTIGATLFLGEKVRARRIGAVLMGFATIVWYGPQLIEGGSWGFRLSELWERLGLWSDAAFNNGISTDPMPFGLVVMKGLKSCSLMFLSMPLPLSCTSIRTASSFKRKDRTVTCL
ncbi:MAG: DMT family transporter, partial [Proteobacteria bacterium]|nr:DMT family transporter [Pseudomonadota bacterium]